jgi:hypothetical protein
MGREHARDVAGIHESVLTDSIYTWIGRPFLEYYYRNLPKSDQFFCHVHTFNGKVTGFLASTCGARRIFFHQILRDSLLIGVVLLRIIAAEPRKLGLILSASRFLFVQRPRMLPHADCEVLSFAVLPEYRTIEVGADGGLRPTEFCARWKIPVAAELFYAAMQNLAARGVRDVKIMTPSDNVTSNRFYAKVGCRLVVEGIMIFDHRTNLYCGRVDEIISHKGRAIIARS